MIVDAHVHVFRRAELDGREPDALVPAERDAPVEQLLALMDGAGVDRAVLVPLDEHDEYVASVLDHRFAGIAVGLHSLPQRRERFAFDGVRTQRLDDMDALRWIAAEGLVLWTYLEPDQLPALLELPAVLPELRIVLNHLGFFPHDMRVDAYGRPRFEDPLPPDRVEAVLSLARHENVHVMLSGQYALSAEDAPYRDLDGLIRRLADAYGAERMLWASDHPWIDDVPGYGATAALPELALPDASEAELAAIRGGTALRLFPRLSGGT
ncbi:amidohydrolase family protein [Candidatus Solirubrobacter pratensis]|uniref:amidohydrolase family protein n=1 Tax=Candidatus Solirubrobacter pratensis TaxID=1298857 RepID=UPI0003F57974|nr:amidohydrolase family protein [Candidatus Solirubrobacter pratensis]